MKTAVIFGVTGQSGSYLSELLLAEGYKVIGVARRVSVPTDERVRHLRSNPKFEMVEGDVTDASSVQRIIHQFNPYELCFPAHEPRYEVYNLAAQSHVKTSFDQPGLTTQSTYVGCLNILEAIRQNRHRERIRFYQASSSEMFGSSYSIRISDDSLHHCIYKDPEWHSSGSKLLGLQNEKTPFLPNSPYAVAKLAAHNLVRVYRESYGIFACSGILFNHESPRRGVEFVTRKITRYLATTLVRRKNDCVVKLQLGNLSAERDWGHVKDYVRGMWLMLQHVHPDDYVLATGQSHSVLEFATKAYAAVGIALDPVERWIDYNPLLLRPSEVPFLRGDFAKAKNVLGWSPTTSFDELVRDMVYSDVATIHGEAVANDVVV